MIVEFKFEPKQAVVTPFGDTGFVSDCNLDDSGAIKYYVKRTMMSQWFLEDELKPAACENVALKGD